MIVNSIRRDLPDEATVAALLDQMGLQQRRVAIEVNQQLVVKAEWDKLVLHAGDQVEIVSFVGGG